MFDTDPDGRRPLPVWQCFVLAALATITGLAMIAVWWPESFPDKQDLVMINGDIATVRVKDDISGTSAGAILPAATSVYFTFKGQAGEFYYPSTHPDYQIVRDYTAVNIDVWVERGAVGSGRPVRIWQLKEHSPYNLVLEPTFIPYEAVIERLTKIDRSMVETGWYVLALAFGFMLLGVGLQHVNRRRDAMD